MRWTTEEYQAYLARQAPAQAPRLAEKVFQAQVLRLAKEHGWLYFHAHDARKSPEGYPDLTLCNGHSILYCELKSATGKLTEAQARWLALLAQAGAETYVWRPVDLPEVIARLTQR